MLPQNRRATHPGQILLHEFLEPLGTTQKALAEHLGVSVQRVNELVRGKRGVTPDSDEQLRKASQIRDRSRRDYAANAWQAAADRGQIDDIPPLDTSSTMGMVRSLSSRLEVLPSIEIAAGQHSTIRHADLPCDSRCRGRCVAGHHDHANAG